MPNDAHPNKPIALLTQSVALIALLISLGFSVVKFTQRDDIQDARIEANTALIKAKELVRQEQHAAINKDLNKLSQATDKLTEATIELRLEMAKKP